MRSVAISAVILAFLSAAALTSTRNDAPSTPAAAQAGKTAALIQIPASIQHEHEAIHAALVNATKAPGRVGAAAKELAGILHPHFVREEEIALPPLGLLARLAAGTPIPNAEASEAMKMADTLKRELPRMMEEHKAIAAATEKLGRAAREDGASAAAEFASDLALHAKTEEEVLYPAAILVGDILRTRQNK